MEVYSLKFFKIKANVSIYIQARRSKTGSKVIIISKSKIEESVKSVWTHHWCIPKTKVISLCSNTRAMLGLSH